MWTMTVYPTEVPLSKHLKGFKGFMGRNVDYSVQETDGNTDGENIIWEALR